MLRDCVNLTQKLQLSVRCDAEQTNEFIPSIGKDMNKKLKSASLSTNRPELTNSMFPFPVETSEIFELIKSLNSSTVEGVDFHLPLYRNINVIFNKCHSKSCFPRFFQICKHCSD